MRAIPTRGTRCSGADMAAGLGSVAMFMPLACAVPVPRRIGPRVRSPPPPLGAERRYPLPLQDETTCATRGRCGRLSSLSSLSSRNVRDHDEIERRSESKCHDPYAIEAGSMLRVQLTGDALGRTHFALSPLLQVTSLMLSLQHSPMTVPARLRRSAVATMRDKHLRLLSAVMLGTGSYIPDFLGPTPARFHDDLNDALHQVCTAPPEQVGGEITTLLTGLISGGISPHPDRERHLRQVIDAGTDRLAQRAATELHQLW